LEDRSTPTNRSQALSRQTLSVSEGYKETIRLAGELSVNSTPRSSVITLAACDTWQAPHPRQASTTPSKKDFLMRNMRTILSQLVGFPPEKTN
jgi:hypothetical protein